MSKMGNIGIDDEDDDSGYDVWRMETAMLNERRLEAINHIEQAWDMILCVHGISSTSKVEEFEDMEHTLDFHRAIWYASTEILPALEVQAVIDSKNQIFVSTGTAGYVDYLTINPSNLIGMKLPIKCWIHTHPFGSAYFSGTDWRTINIWELNMQSAYVLGGEGHYGYWDKTNPNHLDIYVDGVLHRKQDRYVVKIRGEEE